MQPGLSVRNSRPKVFKSSSWSHGGTGAKMAVARSTGPYRQWDDISMQKAAIAVNEEGLSIRKASERYGVPRSTLHDRCTGKVDWHAMPGPAKYLSISEENELATFLLQCADIGYGHTRKQVLAIVQKIIDDRGINAVVTNGWWERFCKRNPQLTLRTTAPLSRARTLASDRSSINMYFDLLEETLHENGIFDNAAAIFNLDESGFPLAPKPPKLVSKKGAKNPVHFTGDGKSQITVLACTSAAGYALPPFVIYDRRTLNPEYSVGEVPGSLYGLSPNGWIDKELFCDWFFNHFLLYAPQVRPLLLLMDGHSTHYCPEVIKEAAAEDIVLFVLPPNTTHCTQPLDKGAFSVLKTAWRQTCHQFMCENPGRIVSRADFASLFAVAWGCAMTLPNITSGFKITGVCPFNKNAFKLIGEDQCTQTINDTVSENPERDFESSLEPQKIVRFTKETYIPLLSPRSQSRDLPSGINVDKEVESLPPRKPISSISKYLTTPRMPQKKPIERKKMSGRVLTSLENQLRLEEKEKERIEKERVKEANRLRREENRKKKEEKKKKSEKPPPKKGILKQSKCELSLISTSITICQPYEYHN